MCIHIHTYTYKYTHAHVHTYKKCIHAHALHARTYKHTRTQYVHKHTHTHTHTYAYAHTHARMHMHTHTHCTCAHTWGEREITIHVMKLLMTQSNLLIYRGNSQTVQAGKVSASAWMDRKTVMVMSTKCQPSSCGTVNRKQRDGSSLEVPYPASIISYNKFMGEVDHGDQLHGYYCCRSKSEKFCKYIFFLLFDMAISNACILLKSSGSCPFKDLKSFRLQLVKDLIGEYCSSRRGGRGSTIIHPLLFQYYPIRRDNERDGS